MQGVSYVKLAISKTDYLVPHINENDREPSWDGNIEVYHKAGDVHAKKDLILKVPVQIKGHKENDLSKDIISYRVESTDMQNYLNIGGTMFLVVYVDEEGENHRIYYAEFLPYGLKKLLRDNSGKKTKSISMKLFPTKKDDISDVFLSFARNMKKQKAAIYSEEVQLETLVKDGIVPELSLGFSYVPKKDITPFDLMLKGNVYVYAKLPYGIELPVEHIENVDMAGTTIAATVTANGKKYYDTYDLVYKKDVIELHFGKSAKFIIDRADQTKQKFSFNLTGRLSDRIIDEEFAISAFTDLQFEIDNAVCSLKKATPEELESFDVLSRKKHLEWLKTIKRMLDILDVKEDLDCSCLIQKDEANIHLLKAAILDEEEVSLKDIDNIFGFFNISNLKILLCVLKRENGKFNIYNYNDAPITVTAKANDGKDYVSSYHVLLKKNEILKSCNLNYDKIIEQIKLVPTSEYYSSQVILFLLELLRAYDESKGEREEIYEAATIISRWLLEEDLYTSKNLLLLNYYQTIKRMRDLEEEEIKELLQIIESDAEQEEIYTGAYLLLDNQEAATIHFNKMSEEEQEMFRNYPIFRFWNETKEEQTNG